MKFLFLGLDAVTYTKVMKFDCPFLQSLCDTHQHGILHSDDPFGLSDQGDPWTGPAWNTIYTGVNAREHGIMSDDWAAGNTAYLKAKVPTIFDLFNKDYNLGLMTPAALYPTGEKTPKIRGWAITGFPAEGEVNKLWKYPDDLSIPEDFTIESHHRCHAPEHFEEAKQEVINKIDLALKLFDSYKTEIGMIGIQYLDFVDHSTPEMADPYHFMDSQIERLFREARPEVFIICGDHGFNPRDHRHSKRGFYVCSLPGVYRERSNFDIAPLITWIVKRHGLDK